MPVIPERLSSRHSSRSAIASQFWESAEHSTRYIDGQVWELPCEPPALNLTGSSGLSRSQQLIAAQSLGVPAIPSFDQNSGGLVLDRVIGKFGGKKWWTALSGRVKAQRMYAIGSSAENLNQSPARCVVHALRDLESYALCARTRVQIAPKMTLNAVIEVPDALQLRSASPVVPRPTSPDHHRTSSRRYGLANAAGMHATLRTTLPGHDLTASVGHNIDYVDSNGEYARVPLATSVDVSSHDRADGLQYRVGLHQVTAPPTEAGPKAGLQPFRTVLHAQGAVAVEGEAHIWRGGASSAATTPAPLAPASPVLATLPMSTSPGGSAASAMPNSAGDVRQSGSSTEQEGSPLVPATGSVGVGGQDETEAGSNGVRGGGKGAAGRVAEIVASAAAADAGDASSGDPELEAFGAVVGGGHRAPADVSAAAAAAAAAAAVNSGGGAGGGGGGTTDVHKPSLSTSVEEERSKKSAGIKGAVEGIHEAKVPTLDQFLRPLERIGEAFHAATHPKSDGMELEKHVVHNEANESARADEKPAQLLPVTAESISAAISDSLALLKQVKNTVDRLTTEVQDGSLQRLSEQLSRKQAPRRRPYSMLLAQPHIKLNAAMGCLARMPLPVFKSLVPRPEFDGVLPHASLHRRGASTSSLASRASFSSQLAEAWEPYLKGTALRMFASAGMSGQIGRFTRPFLDYTAASVRLDVGLSSPHVLGSIPGTGAAASTLDEASRPDKHRAFALEGHGSWHAMSVSFAQQVLGPVRARADFRFALDPTHVPRDQGERSTLKGLAQTALSVRPSLLEAVYGADVVLPGTEGAARLVMWWSPKRREAMAELRLF